MAAATGTTTTTASTITATSSTATATATASLTTAKGQNVAKQARYLLQQGWGIPNRNIFPLLTTFQRTPFLTTPYYVNANVLATLSQGVERQQRDVTNEMSVHVETSKLTSSNETSFLTSNATTLEGREAAIDVFDEADGRSRKVEGNLVGII